jgi:iron uptake system component EfeO
MLIMSKYPMSELKIALSFDSSGFVQPNAVALILPFKNVQSVFLDETRIRFRVALALITVLQMAGTANSEPLAADAERYRPLMVQEIDRSLAGARALRNALRADNIEAAKNAWIESRIGSERAEVFTSGFTELDREIDAWPNAVTGLHAIEAKLFGAGRVDLQSETDALIFHLTDLQTKIRDTTLTAQGLLEGTAKLAYEIGDSKADGGESRFSGTSLDDMRNNVDGIEFVFRIVFVDAVAAADPKLAGELRSEIARLQAMLRVPALARIDARELRGKSEQLIIGFQTAAPLLGLNRPSLQDLVQQ